MIDVVAVIPARSGSKGVPHKNVAVVGGHPLIAYSIAAAHLAGIGRVLVSTDSQAYCDIAVKYGAEVPFLRPVELSTDVSTDFDFMKHLLVELSLSEGFSGKFIVHLRPTSPLRDVRDIRSAVELLRGRPDATSLRSGHRAVESPYKWFRKDDQGFFVGIDPSLSPSDVNRPRQEFPPVFVPNGAVDVLRVEHVLNSANLHGSRMLVFETREILEIDVPAQLESLREIVKSQPGELKKYLDNYMSSKR